MNNLAQVASLNVNGDELVTMFELFWKHGTFVSRDTDFPVKNFIAQSFAQKLSDVTLCNMLLLVESKAWVQSINGISLSSRRKETPLRIMSKTSVTDYKRCRGPKACV